MRSYSRKNNNNSKAHFQKTFYLFFLFVSFVFICFRIAIFLKITQILLATVHSTANLCPFSSVCMKHTPRKILKLKTHLRSLNKDINIRTLTINEKHKMVKEISKQRKIKKLASTLQKICCVSINYQLFIVS